MAFHTVFGIVLYVNLVIWLQLRRLCTHSYRFDNSESNLRLTLFSAAHVGGKVAVLDLGSIDDFSAGWENLLQFSSFNLIVSIIYFDRSHKFIQVVFLLRLSVSCNTFVHASAEFNTWVTMHGNTTSLYFWGKLRELLVLEVNAVEVGRRLNLYRVPLNNLVRIKACNPLFEMNHRLFLTKLLFVDDLIRTALVLFAHFLEK